MFTIASFCWRASDNVRLQHTVECKVSVELFAVRLNSAVLFAPQCVERQRATLLMYFLFWRDTKELRSEPTFLALSHAHVHARACPTRHANPRASSRLTVDDSSEQLGMAAAHLLCDWKPTERRQTQFAPSNVYRSRCI